jgi:hypothetical protein
MTLALVAVLAVSASAQTLTVAGKQPLGLLDGEVWPAELDGDLHTREAIQYRYVYELRTEFIRGLAFRDDGTICRGPWIDPWAQVFASSEFQTTVGYVYGTVFLVGVAQFVAQSDRHLWVITIGYGC